MNLSRVFAALSTAAVLLASCGECSRSVAFNVTVLSPEGTAVPSARVSAECLEASGKGSYLGRATTDGVGKVTVRVPGNDCEGKGDTLSTSFKSCTLTAAADGFKDATQTLSGSEMQALIAGTDQPGTDLVNVALTLKR